MRREQTQRDTHRVREEDGPLLVDGLVELDGAELRLGLEVGRLVADADYVLSECGHGVGGEWHGGGDVG